MIRIAQIEVIAGRPDLNCLKIFTAMSYSDGCEIMLFPEMCLSGYMIGDQWEESEFMDDVDDYAASILKRTKNYPNTCFVLGIPVRDPNGKMHESGRRGIYNAAVAYMNGEVLPFWDLKSKTNFFCAKANLPQYREFDDRRYFMTPRKGTLTRYLQVNDKTFYVTLCEDGWDEHYHTKIDPSDSEYDIEAILNLSCSPYTRGKETKRDIIFSGHANKCGIPVYYANCVGSQNIGKTVYVFDGGSTVYMPDGKCYGTEDFAESVFNHKECEVFNEPEFGRANDAELHDKALVYGIRKYLETIGVKTVVIGASGGVDSAVSACLHVDAIGAENVILVNMPTQYNSEITKTAAFDLANNLGCNYVVVPIGDAVNQTRVEIDEALTRNGLPALSDFNFENIQARDRSSRVLAAISSAVGGVFPCNGNKLELSVGYCTMLGDLAGYLAPLADLWKGEIYKLADDVYGDVIPMTTRMIRASAELSNDQNIEEGKGDPIGPLDDPLIRPWIEDWYKKGPLAAITAIGDDPDMTEATATEAIARLERWWMAYKGLAVSKRVQAPPVLAISRRAFGFDHRESVINARGYFSLAYQDMKAQILGGLKGVVDQN
jgi:NAD+ synthase (glutamine-hydrolysing)